MLTSIEQIYVLILKGQQRDELQKNLKETFSPDVKISWFEVEKTNQKNEGKMEISWLDIMFHNKPDNIAKNITYNHIGMIKDAYMKNYKNVLFLEEDCRFQKIKDKKWKSVDLWLTNSPKWDIFYLGYVNWPIPVSLFITTNILKLLSPLLAHSYILSRRGMEKILNYTEYGRNRMDEHIDKLYSTFPNFQKYGIYPMVAFQKKDPALMVKALDQMNLNISGITLAKWNENFCLIIPILILVLLAFFIVKLFFYLRK
jgi:hypothetical protein